VPIVEEDAWDDEGVADSDEADADDGLICPHCRGDVHEDSQKCPHCGDWITPVDPAERGKRWVWLAAAVLVVIAFLMAAVL